jgi:hypothetical protein
LPWKLITRCTGWQARVGPAANTPAAIPLVSWPGGESTVLLVRVLDREAPTLAAVAFDIEQSCAKVVYPERQRLAGTSTKLLLVEPDGRTAMQNGKQLEFRHIEVRSDAPHRGTTYTVASTSRHVPRVTQSTDGSVAVLLPSPTGTVAYRVAEKRFECTEMSTWSHVPIWLARSSSGNSTCSR